MSDEDVITGNYDEIIRICDDYKKDVKAGHESLEVFYRGQADKTWELKSSLQRKAEELEKSITDVYLENVQFNDEYSAFENIAYMQHYQKPTRLLDFTVSMDVALYFACSGEKDKDGSLYCCSYYRREEKYLDVQVMMEIAQLTEPIKLEEFVIQFLKKYPEYKNGLVLYELGGFPYDADTIETKCRRGREQLALARNILSWVDHGFMITPTGNEYEKIKKWNPRLYCQKGVFFVQGNKLKGYDTRALDRNIPYVTILPELSDIPEAIKAPRFIKKIIIPKEEKETLLSILSEKNINAESLCLG